MINCIALDDEPMALEVIKSLCNRVPYLNLSHTFTQISAAQKHLNKYPVDLIFLDIQMPDMNGVHFYKNIQQDVLVIFTTAFSEYAVEGFEVSAIDYLLKPIELERFEIACGKAKDYLEYLKSSNSEEKEQFLYVRSEYSLVKIGLSEIQFLETMDDYIKIHLKEKEPILTLMSMKKMLAKLPSNEFVRVHRSYVVPMSEVLSVRGKDIMLSHATIPIGTSYKEAFLDRYQQ